MSLRIVSHIPTINATGVYLNDSIKVTFDKRINVNTIDYTTFSVNDHDTFTSVPGGYSVELDSSGNAYTVVFIPNILMTPNRKYDAYLYGSPDSILSINNDSLDDTYSFTFTTGTGIWAEAGESGLPASGYGSSSSPVFSGTYQPDEDITSFSVISTDPKHQEPNVSRNISGFAPSGILVSFNSYIASSVSEVSGLITIQEEDVL